MQPIMNPKTAQKQMMTKPEPRGRGNLKEAWKLSAAAFGLGLLLLVPLGVTALDYLVPKFLTPGQSAATRAGWYLRSNQWQADIRTLVCAVAYVMEAEAGANSPARQLTAPSQPIGPNPPSATQVNAGGLRLLIL
jgi:hypothetical protein